MTDKTGSYVSALSDLYGGFSALTTARTKASALRGAGKQAALEASAASADIMDQGDYAGGMAAANAAAGGGGFLGSTLVSLRDIAAKISRNARQTLVNGQNDTRQYNYEAKVAMRQGTLDFGASLLNAAAVLF